MTTAPRFSSIRTAFTDVTAKPNSLRNPGGVFAIPQKFRFRIYTRIYTYIYIYIN